MTGMLLASQPTGPGTPLRMDTYAPRFDGTYSLYQNAFTGDYQSRSLDFEGSMMNFYASLLTKQESLGADFEKVLYNNLWDLYGA